MPHAAEPKDAKEKGKPNRLLKESSPYLLQHAYNPVDWFAWGPEAFEKAKKEKKIIFLSIGYSSCHWCHVMEKESFDNKDVADFMNKNFVCIKVDREERPDIDDIYMNALHAMGARGGWPMSMFLTPDGKPIVGGTYWPREDRVIEGQTVNGFKTILGKILEVWKEKPKEVEAQAAEYAEQTNESMSRLVRVNPIVVLDRSLAKGAAEAMSEQIDPTHGGIGRRENKF
ncbi:MAG: thioredoxin domain-containing protein, partial [Planctomycetes bacterium]|nr:thioredoxin domain-containing protein [Planctomycetota bacterium]